RQLRSYFPPRDRPISAARLRIDGRIAKGGLVKRKGGSSPAPPRLARRRRQSQRLAAATRPCSFARLMLAALGAGPRPALGPVALKRGAKPSCGCAKLRRMAASRRGVVGAKARPPSALDRRQRQKALQPGGSGHAPSRRRREAMKFPEISLAVPGPKVHSRGTR